jgi:NAD(P)H-dependent flavin oxidoreductase YrpB (nitropropane dioxygenase family)
MNNILNSQYPIVAMAMNKVSDLPLARAVRQAGGVPSLSVFNYFTAPGHVDEKLVEKAIVDYKTEFGDANIFFSLGVEDIVQPRFLKIILEQNIKFIELIPASPKETTITPDLIQQTKEAIVKVQSNGTLVFTKVLGLEDVIPEADGVVLKGGDGAGRGDRRITLDELFDAVHTAYPNQLVIVSGGIGSSARVRHFIDKGATAIGVGTMFAASQESRVSYETKLKMVEADANSIKPLNKGARHNAIIFSEFEEVHHNNTRGLLAGIASPTAGHIFAGKGVEFITDVLPVADIMQRLVKDL